MLLAFAVFHTFFYFLYSRSLFFDLIEPGFENLKHFFAEDSYSNSEGTAYRRLPGDSPEIEKIILVPYERNDLRELEGFKSWRNKIAVQAADRLGSFPKAILLDFHLEDKGPGFAPDASKIRSAFERSGKIVLDFVVSRSSEDYFPEPDHSFLATTAITLDPSDSVRLRRPLRETFTNIDAPSTAVLHSALDFGAADGPVKEIDEQFRKMRLFSRFDGRLYENVWLTLFRINKGWKRSDMDLSFSKGTLSFPSNERPIRFDRYGQFRLDLKASESRFQSVPFSKLQETDPVFFKDKTVIVGAGGSALNTDLHYTPAGIFHGPELIATGLYQLLASRFFTEFPKAALGATTFLLCLCLALLKFFWGRFSRIFTAGFFLVGLVLPLVLFGHRIYIDQSYFLTVLLLNHVLFLGNSPRKEESKTSIAA